MNMVHRLFKFIALCSVLIIAACNNSGVVPSDDENQVGTVAISYNEGSRNIVITCSSEESVIYYTTDGSTPDHYSEVYSGPFDLQVGDTEIKAAAYNYGKWSESLPPRGTRKNSSLSVK